MTGIFFELFLFFYNWQPLSNVNNNNKLKQEITKTYYQNKLETTEKKLYQIIKNQDDEPELLGNLGLVLYKEHKYREAKKTFKDLQNSNNIQVAVEALSHLGLISCLEGDTTLAISQFENVLKKDFKHEVSRYNLELLKKKFNFKKNNSRANNQNNKLEITKNKVQNKNELDPRSEKEELLARLSKINMSESKARLIFETLGNNEIKYIQQRKQKNKSNQDNFQSW